MTTTMRFPLDDLLDEDRCYAWLLRNLHPEGLHCPNGHDLPPDQCPHTRNRAPVVEYRCRQCHRVFNVFTNTALNGIRYPCSKLVMVLHGFMKGTPTLQMSDELSIDRSNLLTRRHDFQALLQERFSPSALLDHATEADEMFQNAGEKGIRHPDPEDPPRRRANKQRGHGNFDNDRPPIVSTVGRESGEVRMVMVERTDQATLEAHIDRTTQADAHISTDEWSGYAGLSAMGRDHHTVCHNPAAREWARDDDGDGIREVHCNTQEGIWTGVRNFLRPFRGVSKWYLSGYVAVFAWAHNTVWASPAFFSALLRCSSPEAT